MRYYMDFFGRKINHNSDESGNRERKEAGYVWLFTSDRVQRIVGKRNLLERLIVNMPSCGGVYKGVTIAKQMDFCEGCTNSFFAIHLIMQREDNKDHLWYLFNHLIMQTDAKDGSIRHTNREGNRCNKNFCTTWKWPTLTYYYFWKLNLDYVQPFDGRQL